MCLIDLIDSRYSVENAYIAEKADACSALGELAVNIGSVYLLFVITESNVSYFG